MDADNSLVTVEKYTPDVPDFSDYSGRIRHLVEASVASETRRAYASRLKRFVNWCNEKGFSSTYPIEAEILAMYITDMAGDGLSNATITQTMAAVSTTHKAQGLNSPTESLLVKKVLKGFRREYGTAHKKHDAATVEVVRYLLNSIPDDNSPKNVRDKAIIALGFAGAFRRSELCAIDVEHLKWVFRGTQEILLIEVVRSKADQEGRGMTKAIFPSKDTPYSPTELLKRWLKIRGSEGALFTRILKGEHITEERLTPQSVRLIVKHTAAKAGLSLDLTAHSLRSGFVTTAIRQGKTERSIMNQTGHRSTQVLREYFLREDAIEDNAADNII